MAPERAWSSATPDESAGWRALADAIITSRDRLANPEEFLVLHASPLAQDDRATAPYHLTSAWRSLMASGIDHLDTVRALALDHKELRPMAPYSLCRGALEAFATAYWIVSPASGKERIERVLRWQYKDLCDADAVARLGENPTPRATRLKRILEIAAATQTEEALLKRPLRSTTILQAADTASRRPSHDFERVWRVCSGFAHGRRWAIASLLNRTKVNIDHDGMDGYRLTTSFSQLLWATRESVSLLDLSISRYTILAKSVSTQPKLRTR